MKSGLLYGLLLLGFNAFSQAPILQAFEVDSAAEPRGGMAYLSSFLQTNLRKPVPAAANGLGGRVILSAVVEPDGRVSDVSVVQSLRPDMDREAVRVFALFGAWKPAQKGDQIVRQRVTLPVFYKPNTPFLYANGTVTAYFGKDQKPVADSSEAARYKQVTPLDTTGLPTGDQILYERKRTGWAESSRLRLVRQMVRQPGAPRETLYALGNQNAGKQWQGDVFTVNEAGKLLAQAAYTDGKHVGPQISYHSNGMVAQKSDDYETKYAFTSWYANGQIKQIWTIDKGKLLTSSPAERITAIWDSTGRQLVKDGNGQAIYQTKVQSRSDTSRQTQCVEAGPVANGYRQGTWTGRYADGSYFYQEQYEQDLCREGKALATGGDTLRYTASMQPPEFKGGMAALGQFLAQNLHYPPAAQRARVQGRVFISFVINTDGSLADVDVLQGLGFGTDEEALRVVKATSGRWTAGVQRGQKVRVKYNLPINFTLQ